MKNFHYNRSYKIIYWGCCFDSLLELKYAISIQDQYEFIHARIPVYYDPATKKPTEYIRECTRRYTPDFLIRHKITGEAFWIEIKPEKFDDFDQLALRKLVAENYVSWKNYDWKYKIVFGNEIVLKKEQMDLFEELCQLQSKSAFKIHLGKLNNRFDRAASPLFTALNANTEFIMFGNAGRVKQRGFSALLTKR